MDKSLKLEQETVEHKIGILSPHTTPPPKKKTEVIGWSLLEHDGSGQRTQNIDLMIRTCNRQKSKYTTVKNMGKTSTNRAPKSRTTV